MKPFDYYSKPKTAYPNKKDYITFYVYDRGEVVYCGTCINRPVSKLKEDYPNAVIQQVLDEEAYKAHLNEYHAETTRLDEEFQNDLFEDFDVSDNPKRFKCFELAWERGHSSGVGDVYNCFGDLVELIREN